MGTNYYLSNVNEKPHCESCTCYARLHIGKSSAGWCFSLHVIPEAGLNTLDDWKKKFSEPGMEIYDEYGYPVSLQKMMDCITNRSSMSGTFEKVPRMYSSWEVFHNENQSEFGPRGMLRHKIGKHCLSHGEGTWDMIPGEFS